MAILSWIVSLILLFFLAAVVMGFILTKRSFLTEIHSPAEVGLAFEEVTFKSTDGFSLKGWWVPASDSDQAIIQLHGHGGSMDPDIQYLPAWNTAGFNVLMFDFRGHGRSQGHVTTFGYLERYDVQGAVKFLKEEKDINRIALVGFSLGGMVAILSAPLCPEVGAFVEDGAPARLRSALTIWGIEHHLPTWAAKSLAWMAVFGASIRLGVNLFHHEPVRWIGKISPRPLMIIHGDLDQYCPDFEELLSAGEPIEVWRLPDVGHVQASQVCPEEYRKRVVSFLERHL